MTTQARELAKIVNNAGDLFFVDDVALASDGAVLNFGADNDVTLTHVADTGLLINSTRQLQFGDSGTYIHQSADGVLDLVSDTEIELNATTLDINANVDISGSLDINGNALVLDADADTQIDAATDDEIHFTVAGSETVYMGVTSYNASDRIVLTNTAGNASATIVGSTTGESSVFMADGTSGNASYRGYVQYQHTNDNMNFGTAGSEAMRIDSSGNVGIGVTSSLQKLSVTSASGTIAEFLGESGPHGLRIYGNDGGFGAIGHVSSGGYDLAINSSGNVGIGGQDITSGGGFAPTLVLDGSAFTAMIVKSSSGTQEGVISNLGDAGLRFDVAGSATASNNKILFQTSNTNSNFNTTLRMAISSNGNIGTSDGGSQIASGSDRRLKQNINSLSDSLNIVNNLNPVSFNWADNFSESEKDKTLYGFVAQEVQDVFPDAVEDFSGGADIELNGETIENPLTVRERFLIPVLVKALQEADDKIEALEARITTLEG